MSNESIVIFAFVIVIIVLLIAVVGLVKPLYRRYTGKTESLSKQDEQNRLLKEQNDLMKKILEKEK